MNLNKLRPLKQYRTCERCKSMFRGMCGSPDHCELGYDLKWKKGTFGLRIGYPGEPCPKPTTNKEWLDSPAKWERPQR